LPSKLCQSISRKGKWALWARITFRTNSADVIFAATVSIICAKSNGSVPHICLCILKRKWMTSYDSGTSPHTSFVSRALGLCSIMHW
jgi:hypothetical protein